MAESVSWRLWALDSSRAQVIPEQGIRARGTRSAIPEVRIAAIAPRNAASGCHSPRIATSGSTRDARRAGTQLASAATSTTSSATPPKTSGSVGLVS